MTGRGATRRGKRPSGRATASQSKNVVSSLRLNSSARAAALWSLLLICVLFAYLPAVQGGALWDDDNHLTKPELYSLHGLYRIWFEVGATAQYYPLLHSAFWIEHRVWGDAPAGYHLINIALHATAAFLVWAIMKRLVLPGATLAAFVFALHPVCVEAVAWMSEQKSVLSGVLYLASAHTYVYFDQSRRRWQYWLAFALFVLAVLAKSVTATLPAALLVVFWCQRGRLTWTRDVRPLIPWFAVAIPAGLFTAWVEKKFIGAQGADFSITGMQRLLLAGRAIWFYGEKLVWPVNLAFFYPRWNISQARWWQFLFPIGAIAVAGALAMCTRRSRGPLAAFLIFAGTLFPALGFFNVYPFRFSYVADHFQYLAALGILAPLSALLAQWMRTRYGKLALFALVGVLSTLTWNQSRMYTDAETLYRLSLAHNPANWLAHNNLGSILVRAPEKLPEAIAEYREAVRLEPDAPEPHFNLGAALVQTDQAESQAEAIAEYETALRLRPNYPEAHSNLGKTLSHVPGRLPEAIEHLETAVRLAPDLVQIHLNLGNAFARLPDHLPDAIAEYETALRFKPDYAEAHFNLGNVLSQMPGRSADAVAQYEAALRLRPDLEQAREAIEHLQQNQRKAASLKTNHTGP